MIPSNRLSRRSRSLPPVCAWPALVLILLSGRLVFAAQSRPSAVYDDHNSIRQLDDDTLVIVADDVPTTISIRTHFPGSDTPIESNIEEMKYRDADSVWITSRLGHRLDGAILYHIPTATVLKKFWGRPFSISPSGAHLAYGFPAGRVPSDIFVDDSMVFPAVEHGFTRRSSEGPRKPDGTDYSAFWPRDGLHYELVHPLHWLADNTLEASLDVRPAREDGALDGAPSTRVGVVVQILDTRNAETPNFRVTRDPPGPADPGAEISQIAPAGSSPSTGMKLGLLMIEIAWTIQQSVDDDVITPGQLARLARLKAFLREEYERDPYLFFDVWVSVYETPYPDPAVEVELSNSFALKILLSYLIPEEANSQTLRYPDAMIHAAEARIFDKDTMTRDAAEMLMRGIYFACEEQKRPLGLFEDYLRQDRPASQKDGLLAYLVERHYEQAGPMLRELYPVDAATEADIAGFLEKKREFFAGDETNAEAEALVDAILKLKQSDVFWVRLLAAATEGRDSRLAVDTWKRDAPREETYVERQLYQFIVRRRESAESAIGQSIQVRDNRLNRQNARPGPAPGAGAE